MMEKLQKKVLERLVDSYEKSKTFQGKNKVNQSFSVHIGKLFPRYQDDAEYDYFCQVNEAMEELSAVSLVTLEYEKKGVLKTVRLNPERLASCYERLGRTPRKREQEELARLWDEFGDAEHRQDKFLPLLRYIEAQRIKIGKNQNIEYYNHDILEYRELLSAAEAVLNNREEIFIRNFSIQIFHDSKRVEELEHKLESLLYQYGEFEEKESVLEECGIVHTPTYVMMKGKGILTLGEQEIDLSRLRGDIGLSTESVKGLRNISILGNRVVTVENLTSFHDYPTGDDFVIYLGGFHNKVKRDFLVYVYEGNPQKKYRHFGDIDAGGFYILEHLKRKTGIAFHSLHMDLETLRKHREEAKPLTDNDRKRLLQLREELEDRKTRGEAIEDYREVIDYMLAENCKLEQEAIKIEVCG